MLVVQALQSLQAAMFSIVQQGATPAGRQPADVLDTLCKVQQLAGELIDHVKTQMQVES